METGEDTKIHSNWIRTVDLNRILHSICGIEAFKFVVLTRIAHIIYRIANSESGPGVLIHQYALIADIVIDTWTWIDRQGQPRYI